ncbi:MAG: hypothetical protein KAS32_24670 [Candidatus Peribacteraceae bacterium]|nr:hypothetical protein [Candidatus Peribacteraceae bacterium]
MKLSKLDKIVYGALSVYTLSVIAFMSGMCLMPERAEAAGEVSTRQFIEFNKNTNGVVSISINNQKIDVVGKNWIYATQPIGTNATTIEKGAVTNIGMAFFHNMRPTTNQLLIGYDDSGFKHLLEVRHDEWQGPMRLSQDTPQGLSTNAVSDLEYLFIED